MKNQEDILSRHPGWARYARFMRKLDFAVLLLSIALFAVTFNYVKHLRVKSDFKEMLPEKFQSVTEFNKIEKRVQSVGNLILLAGDAPWPAIKSFIDDFVPKANAELSDMISGVEYNVKDVADFYDKNKYLYIDLPDLQEIHDRLKRKIDYEKLKRTQLLIEFGDEEPSFDVSDIQDKYKKKAGGYLDYKDGYFTTPEGTLAAVILRPREGATDVEFAEKLMAKAGSLIESMQPARYDPNLKFTFGGRYQKTVTEYKSLIGDIVKTTLLCIVMVGGVVFLFFRRIKPCLLVTITVSQGVLVALALGYVFIGYLTSQTAFLGSIIVGNGINFSLILMARYIEERREKGREISDAMAIALSQTWKPTLVAASTTSASFAALMMTDIRGFSQFGFIGGTGMVVCWCCTYFFLPAWLSIFERIWKTKAAPLGHWLDYSLYGWLGKTLIARDKAVLKATAGISICAAILAAWYLPNSLEYNFDNMRFKPPKEHGTAWELSAREKINEIFGQSTTPSIVLADRPSQADPICDAIRQKAGPEGEKNLIDDCKTLDSMVPKDQPQKMDILASMRKMLESSTLKFLNEDQLKEVRKFQAQINLRPIALNDVPPTVTNKFEEIDGSKGKIVYVYPKPTANLWNGRELIRFADIIREVDLPDGEKIYSSGEPVIFADLLRVVVKEGPLVTLFSFALVLILIVINFRGSKDSGIVMGSLMLGILWLVALLPIFGIKLNFLNFIALPITFGIGVDYAVNIYQRYKQDGTGSIQPVLKYTGGAVTLCSLTTVIGYSVLMTSRNLGLVSFGATALLGEITCLTAAIVSLPAFISWNEKRQRVAAKETAKESGECCAAEE